MGRKQILVVDDEWEVAELLIFLLVTEGYRVEHAGNGQVALDMLMERNWDLVLTDLMMPVLDGSQLIGRMQQCAELAAIPVMVLSTFPEYLVREKCGSFPCFLQKPFRLEELLGQVRKLLAVA